MRGGTDRTEGSMDRHRRHGCTRRRWSAAVPAVILGVLGAGVLVLTQLADRAGPAGADTSVVVSPALASSTAAVALAARSVSQPMADRGTVGGITQLHAAVPADTRTWVAFVLRGPGTIVRVASAAPYEATVDTRLVPDGAYTLNEIVFQPSRTPSVRASRLQIVNTPPQATIAQVRAQPQPTVGPPATVAASTPATPPPATSATPSVTLVLSPANLAASVATTPSAQVLDEASQVVALTNAERAKAGCGALTADPRLTTAAQTHSADMSAHNYFSHNSQDGRTPFQRMAKAGYEFSMAAENIAAGQRTPAEVVRGWMNSAGHRENILNCSLKQIGVGYAAGGSYGTYWTQDFGTP
ncbi:hypothetical protein FDG2_0913 [Candidatus Protofrankia californiensis]|uniref:SCP domain-containing protein n=1 Tax=Candidatus Protofrankia californiensis TaxID=1839754 RepID=A0A1C3NUP7_9ACTN|nr:hypothetical protein FDG2_0913 [Candidatus Protofrankia californiensis]